MSVRIHPVLNSYITEICMMSMSTTVDVPTYRRKMLLASEIFDLGGFDKRFPHINKLAYCIHAILLWSA